METIENLHPRHHLPIFQFQPSFQNPFQLWIVCIGYPILCVKLFSFHRTVDTIEC